MQGGREREKEDGMRGRGGEAEREREGERGRERERKREKTRDQTTICPTNHHKLESTTTIQVETHTNHRWVPQQLKWGP